MKELNKKRNFSRRVFLRTAAAVGTALAVSPELNKVHAVTRVAACDEAMPTGKAKAALSVKFHRPESSTLAGCCGMAIVAVAQCLALMSGCSFFVYEGLMLLLLFCMGMTFTSTTALAMDCQRENAGAASALLGAVGFAAGGIVSPLVGLGNILSSTGIVFVVCACCSLFCMLAALGRRRVRVCFTSVTVQGR